LLLEAGESRRLHLGQYLQRDDVAPAPVAGLVDDAHAAPPQLPEDLVVGHDDRGLRRGPAGGGGDGLGRRDRGRLGGGRGGGGGARGVGPRGVGPRGRGPSAVGRVRHGASPPSWYRGAGRPPRRRPQLTDSPAMIPNAGPLGRASVLAGGGAVGAAV